jgi:transcriptional regulator with XRE-family HTH domain
MSNDEKEHMPEYSAQESNINDFIILRATQLGLKQIDLVNETGIKPSKMSKFFNRRLEPNMEDLEKLTKPLKVSKEVLWIIAGVMLPPNKESAIVDELKSLEKLLSEHSKNEIAEGLNIDIKLNADEKRFIQEYIEFVKYKRQGS